MPVDFDHIASQIAEYANYHLMHIHRGAVSGSDLDAWIGDLEDQAESKGLAAVYGNDGHEDPRVRRRAEDFKRHLEEEGHPVAGFGVSSDGYSWAMLVSAGQDHEFLDDMVWDHWRDEVDSYIDESERVAREESLIQASKETEANPDWAGQWWEKPGSEA